MNWNKITALVLALLLVCLSAVSCKSGGEEGSSTETETPETEAAIPPEQQTDYTDDAERLAYIEAFGRVFAELAESDAADFTVSETDGGLTVTGYTGSASRVRVPAAIGGKPVVALGDAVFAGHSEITELYLPDGVTAVGEGVLAGLTQLRALHTSVLGGPNAPFLGYLFAEKGTDGDAAPVKYEDNALHVPASLQYLELGGGIDAIGDCALFDCNDLVCIGLSDSVKSLGDYALFQCASLLAINVDGLTRIGEHALDSCRALTRLDFGEGLEEIGMGALEGCGSLRALTLPFVGGTQSENTYLGYLFGASVPDFSAGYYPNYLVEITLLSTATSLGDHAFYECDSLLRVTLPEGVTSIGVRAFSYCTRLETVAIPDSVTSIRASAFFGCRGLTDVRFGDGSTLSSIGINAFYGCSSLISVALPRSLSALPASCFADCTSLATVDLGGVTAVGKNAFRNCTALTSLRASEGISFEDGNEACEALLKQ